MVQKRVSVYVAYISNSYGCWFALFYLCHGMTHQATFEGNREHFFDPDVAEVLDAIENTIQPMIICFLLM
jgi:hypothetical protein